MSTLIINRPFVITQAIASKVFGAWRAGSLLGGPVTKWPNIGSGGTAYDLMLTQNAPNATLTMGSNPSYVSFVGSDYLDTATQLPVQFTGNKSRTIGTKVYFENNGSMNFMGYGQNSGGGLFDVMTWYADYLMPHYHGNQIHGPAKVIGEWTTLEIRITEKPTGQVLIEDFVKGVLVLSVVSSAIQTLPSALRIGGGIYPPYNTTDPRRIAWAYAADTALTNEEMIVLRTTLSS